MGFSIIYWREPKGRGGGEYSRKFYMARLFIIYYLLFTPYPKAFIRIIIPILTEDVPLSFMNCNNKTAKNKDSSIPDFSNGQFRFSSRYSSLVFVKKQHLDTVINVKVPLLYPLLNKWYPLHIPCLGRYREHSLGV